MSAGDDSRSRARTGAHAAGDAAYKVEASEPAGETKMRPGARAVSADELAGIAWWNALGERERERWLELAGERGDASVATAWAEYKRRRDAGEPVEGGGLEIYCPGCGVIAVQTDGVPDCELEVTCDECLERGIPPSRGNLVAVRR